MSKIAGTILSSLLVCACVTQAASASTHVTKNSIHKNGANLLSGPIVFPANFMPSVKTYGAVGDGKTDDTAAIQAALADGRSSASADYFGHPKALYFPPGTYVVHDTLQWVGCCVTLQGSGPGATTILLAPNSSGFNNPAVPKPVISMPSGNTSFHQNIWDMKIEVSAGNPGATALSYISNNMGSVNDVYILSDDGQGHAGIDLTRLWPGPLMIRDIQVAGFDVGINIDNSEYSTTFEGVSLNNQNIAGIRNNKQPISIRGFVSNNSVPALTNTAGMVVLIDATLQGGSSANPAIQTNANTYLRNVTSTGYMATVQDLSGKTPVNITGTIAERTVGTAQTLTGTLPAGSLNLPISETPIYTTSAADSAPFIPKWYGDASGLQALLNGGKSTIYFPFTTYFVKNEVAVVVPDSVQRITGYSSPFFGSSDGLNGGSVRFIISSNSTQPLIIDDIVGVKIDHRGSRPVVIKNAELFYTNVPGAGALYMEDVQLKAPLTVQQNQQVWARQLDDEVTGTKITNTGGSLWIMGLKTEVAGEIIATTDGSTELLGGLIYPAATVPSSGVAFHSQDSQVSYIYSQSVYHTNYGYPTQVEEIRNGLTKKLNVSPSTLFRMPLFVGYQ